MLISEKSIARMKEMTKLAKEKGKVLSLDEAFKKYPAEWKLVDGKPVHIEEIVK